MRIGVIIGRIGGVDGVALETEKWIDVLIEKGHEIFILSGEFEDRNMDAKHETVYAPLSFFSTECMYEQSKAFFYPDKEPTELIKHLESTSEGIAKEIVWWLVKNKIDLLISENASALPCHLSMAMGIKKAVELTGIKTITHDHDYGWDRGRRYISIHKEVNALVEDYFPLILPNVVHAVINLNAKENLRQLYDVDSVVVPNVMDFNKSYGVLNEDNSKLKQKLGFKEEDLLLFQITRIVRRKSIETAISLIHKLKDDRIKLVITGNYNDDSDHSYYDFLSSKVKDLSLENQVVFASNLISHNPNEEHHDGKMYNLSDAYANSTACTYFSTFEGFGNAFLEAVVAKRPIFVNNYKPVFMPDIGSKGFKVVVLENNELTEEKVAEMKNIIFDKSLQNDIADFNFELGKKYFSYEVLGEKLDELINMLSI